MTEFMPKPLIEIGGIPLLYHIVNLYYEHGYREFDVACGYRGDMIYDYVKRNPYRGAEVICHDTGDDTETANRIQQVDPKSTFMLTYGDGVGCIDISGLVEQHNYMNASMTITGARARSKWGYVNAEKSGTVRGLIEKPILNEYINSGYWVVEPHLVGMIEDNQSTEQWCDSIAKKHKVYMYRHNRFWLGMDTYKDFDYLSQLWQEHQTWDLPLQ